jgi:hypothetical protein
MRWKLVVAQESLTLDSKGTGCQQTGALLTFLRPEIKGCCNCCPVYFQNICSRAFLMILTVTIAWMGSWHSKSIADYSQAISLNQ